MLVPAAEPIRYDALVQAERVHASLYTDSRVFADEMDRIFFRSWVFIGHESEIPLAGDFVTRHIGTQPVIMARAMDGRVSVHWHTPMFLKGAPEFDRRLLRQSEAAMGPGSFLLPDDLTITGRNQLGLHSRRTEWLELSRGVHREYVDDDGRRIAHLTDETTNRGFFRQYRQLMTGA